MSENKNETCCTQCKRSLRKYKKSKAMRENKDPYKHQHLYLANPENRKKHNAQVRQYYLANREKILAKRKQKRLEKLEKLKSDKLNSV